MKKGPATTNKVKQKRTHGFLHRSSTHGGRKVLQRRRLSKRKSLTV